MVLKTGRVSPDEVANNLVDVIGGLLKTGHIAMGAMVINHSKYTLTRVNGLWGKPTNSTAFEHKRYTHKARDSHPSWKLPPADEIPPYEPTTSNDVRTAIDEMVVVGTSHASLGTFTQVGGFEVALRFDIDDTPWSCALFFGQHQSEGGEEERYSGAWIDTRKTFDLILDQPQKKLAQFIRQEAETNERVCLSTGVPTAAIYRFSGTKEAEKWGLSISTVAAEETEFHIRYGKLK